MLWQTATISSSAKEFVIEHTPLVVHSLIAGKPVGADLSGTLPIMMINKINEGSDCRGRTAVPNSLRPRPRLLHGVQGAMNCAPTDPQTIC